MPGSHVVQSRNRLPLTRLEGLSHPGRPSTPVHRFAARSVRLSHHGPRTLTNRWLWGSLAGVLALQLAVTHLGPMQRLFDTTSVSAAQWAVCVAVASTVLMAEEARKLAVRRHTPAH